MSNTNPSAKLWLYQNRIQLGLRYQVDCIDDYLATCTNYLQGKDANLYTHGTDYYANIQYQKIEKVKTIKLALPQECQYDAARPNYARIINVKSDGTESQSSYWFVTDWRWASSNTIEMTLVMDFINTACSRRTSTQAAQMPFHESNWTNKTYITRQHKDRFCKTSGDAFNLSGMYRKVDWRTENNFQDCYKVLDSRQDAFTASLYDGYNWYLIFASEYADDTKEVVANLKAYLACDHALSIGAEWDVSKGIDITTNYHYITNTSGESTEYCRLYNGRNSYNVYPYDTARTFIQNGTTLSSGKLLWLQVSQSKVAGYNIVKVWWNDNGEKSGYITNLIQADGHVIGYYVSDNSVDALDLTCECHCRIVRKSVSNLLTISNIESNSYTELISTNGSYGPSGSATAYRLLSIPAIDVALYNTLQTTNKIIKLPFCPFTYDEDYSTGSILLLHCPYTDPSVNGSYTDLFPLSPKLNLTSARTLNNMTKFGELRVSLSGKHRSDTHSIENESKLYNSQFLEQYLAYDTTTVPVDNEKIAITDSAIASGSIDPTFTPKFYCSPLGNAYGIKLTNYGGFSYIGEDTYPLTLISTGKNEMTLYNSEYLNYMRTGYNYDKKTAVINTVASVINTGVASMNPLRSITQGNKLISDSKSMLKSIFEVASKDISDNFASTMSNVANNLYAQGSSLKQSGKNSLTSLATQGAVSGITSAVNSWRALKQKQITLQNASIGITLNDDFQMFNWYNDDSCRYKWVVKTLKDEDKKAIYEYLRRMGYAECAYSRPDVTTRYRYNYIECIPDYGEITSSDIPMDWTMLEEMKTEFAQGVTVFHNVGGTWDFSQGYENWETWIAQVLS